MIGAVDNSTLTTPAEASSAPATNDPISTPVEVTQSSTPDTGTGQEATPTLNDSTASSSPADAKDAKKESLLDVVKTAFDAKDPANSSTAKAQPQPAPGQPNDAPGKDSLAQKDGSEAQSDVPFHNHPRWKAMIAERESLKPAAEQYGKITTFMKTNGLSPQEMAEGLHVMALMKTNPVAAYQQLQGYIQNLARFTGDVLPPELKAKVDEGLTDPETAKRLAQLEAEREFSYARQLEIQQRQQAEQEAFARQQAFDNSQQMVSAVMQWEQAEKAKDPDWAQKYEMVQDRVKALLAQQPASNPSDAIKIAQRALADVNARLRPLAGRTMPLRTPASSLSSASATPAPRSLADLVRMGLQGS
jgi:hypothetical protein